MKNNNLRIDYLPNHKEITLYQREDMFRLNTDSALLGEFFVFNDNESLLDIGTNNGVLLLYASIKAKGKLFGIDVFLEALELCKKNLAAYSVPKEFEFRKSLPKTLIGKVDFRKVEEQESKQLH